MDYEFTLSLNDLDSFNPFTAVNTLSALVQVEYTGNPMTADLIASAVFRLFQNGAESVACIYDDINGILRVIERPNEELPRLSSKTRPLG